MYDCKCCVSDHQDHPPTVSIWHNKNWQISTYLQLRNNSDALNIAIFIIPGLISDSAVTGKHFIKVLLK